MTPSIGSIVHYVSYGTPGGEYKSECRAAIVTQVHQVKSEPAMAGLCVLNPTGQFFNQAVHYHDGAGKPGDPECPNQPHESGPHRYCACGWTEAAYQGGTWHWPNHGAAQR